MNRNTTDATPAFITVEPDWSLPVRMWVTFKTSVQRSRNGVEQRNSDRSNPLYAIGYGRNHSASEWPARKVSLMAELSAAVVVPIWVRGDGFVSEVSNVVTLDVTTVRSPFKVGSYAYFVEVGKTSVFRLITAVSGLTITLASGNAAYPDIAVPTYSSAADVYPCIVGLRKDNSAGWAEDQVDQVAEDILVEEL